MHYPSGISRASQYLFWLHPSNYEAIFASAAFCHCSLHPSPKAGSYSLFFTLLLYAQNAYALPAELGLLIIWLYAINFARQSFKRLAWHVCLKLSNGSVKAKKTRVCVWKNCEFKFLYNASYEIFNMRSARNMQNLITIMKMGKR